MLRCALTTLLLATLSGASFCGSSAIPYSLEASLPPGKSVKTHTQVLPDGQPILGCSRPICFGWAPSGQPATNDGSFYLINDHADGFLRATRASVSAFGPGDARFYRPQVAICDAFFSSTCPGVNQWVGGITPLGNVSAAPTSLQCCAYDGLLLSEDRGQASLRGGQMVVGGEVDSAGLQFAFDYISDIAKIMLADGTVQYDVSIRRMQCADLPEMPELSKSNAIEAGDVAQAFQAPNVAVEQPLPLPPAGSEDPTVPQDGFAILEELVQEEAVQLPPATQFQPALQPPPPFSPPPPQPPVQAFQAPQFVPQAPAQYDGVCVTINKGLEQSPPVAFSNVAGAGNGQWCFSDDMTVRMMDGSTKRMDELKTNDWVLAANEKELAYVPVEFWLHRVPSQEAEFNEFVTGDGKTIKLTDKHYVFKGDCSRVNAGKLAPTSLPQNAVFADEVHVGDCLFTIEEDLMVHEVRVVHIRRVKQTGIYAPMTSSGRIIVNGIHASCHSVMHDKSIGQTVFETANRIHDSLFGSSSEEIVETPSTLNTLLAMAELAIPKHLLIM